MGRDRMKRSGWSLARRAALLTVCAVAVVALLWAALLLLFVDAEEIPYRLSRFHTYGEVTVTVDGEPRDIDGVPVALSYLTPYESTDIRKGKFRISKGAYGENTYEFTVPASVWGEGTDDMGIAVKLDHFNTNWWHIYDLEIHVDIITAPLLKASMSGKLLLRRSDSPAAYEFAVPETEITGEDRVLRGWAGRP